MEQHRGAVGGDGGGRGVANMQQQQAKQRQDHPPPQQPQKCPRCDSLNTKFCYYNNYSLSQPRYFCKTCRRYWTQGGSLRNVPVGGGCRKGKRLKRSSSPSPDDLNTSSMTNSVARTKGIDGLPSTPLIPIGAAGAGVPPPSMFYPGTGFLSSLAAFQSFNQSMNVGGGGGGEFGGGGGSNLALLQGFNHPFHTQQMHHLQQQQQHHHHLQQQNLYLHQPHNLNLGISDGLEEKVVVHHQANRPTPSHQEWSQNFNSPTSEATDYWSNNNSTTNTSTNSSIINNTSTDTTLGVSLNPTHWTDHLTGYGVGPPSSQQQQQPPPPPSTATATATATATTTTSSSSPSFL